MATPWIKHASDKTFMTAMWEYTKLCFDAENVEFWAAVRAAAGRPVTITGFNPGKIGAEAQTGAGAAYDGKLAWAYINYVPETAKIEINITGRLRDALIEKWEGGTLTVADLIPAAKICAGLANTTLNAGSNNERRAKFPVLASFVDKAFREEESIRKMTGEAKRKAAIKAGRGDLLSAPDIRPHMKDKVNRHDTGTFMVTETGGDKKPVLLVGKGTKKPDEAYVDASMSPNSKWTSGTYKQVKGTYIVRVDKGTLALSKVGAIFVSEGGIAKSKVLAVDYDPEALTAARQATDKLLNSKKEGAFALATSAKDGKALLLATPRPKTNVKTTAMSAVGPSASEWLTGTWSKTKSGGRKVYAFNVTNGPTIMSTAFAIKVAETTRLNKSDVQYSRGVT